MTIKTARADLLDALEWRPIATAPFGRDVELAALDYEGTHALVFPCRGVQRGWAKSMTKEPVDVYPSHRRDWSGRVSPLFSHPVF
ncbi:hypothetical protein DXU07_05510 [Bradyrhizobium elkanii]|jgi:hypothetical protein|nr:hypothetical protein [Bradyrhizobium elkanii]